MQMQLAYFLFPWIFYIILYDLSILSTLRIVKNKICFVTMIVELYFSLKRNDKASSRNSTLINRMHCIDQFLTRCSPFNCFSFCTLQMIRQFIRCTFSMYFFSHLSILFLSWIPLLEFLFCDMRKNILYV